MVIPVLMTCFDVYIAQIECLLRPCCGISLHEIKIGVRYKGNFVGSVNL